MLNHIHYKRNLALALAMTVLTACQTAPAPTELETDAAPSVEDDSDGDVQPAPDDEGVEPVVPVSGGAVQVHLGAAPLTLDPTAIAPLDTAGMDIVVNVFSGLTQINPITRRVEPALAREWQVSDDGLTWTVFLRDDLNWVRVNEAGDVEAVRPIVSADVVTAVERGCRNDVVTTSVQRLYIIEGCRQLNRLPPEEITPAITEQTLRARILNDTVVEFTLTEDYGAFAALMAAPVMYPVPNDVIAAHGANWTLPENIITSGPYALSVGQADAQYQLLRNPQSTTGSNLDIVDVSVGDLVDPLGAVTAGDFDFVVVPDQVAIDSPEQVQRLALPVTAFITINHESPVINQAEIKAAFSRGLDREAIVTEFQQAQGQLAMPAYVANPPGSVDGSLYQDVSVPFDAGAAQLAINDAGLNSCLGLPDRTFAVDNSAQSIGLVQAFVSNWATNLSCRPEAFTVEPLTQREILVILKRPPEGVEQPRPGFAMFYWQGETPDAQHWYADIFGCRDPFFRDSYLNSLRECSDADELLLRLYREHDPDVRASLQPQVEQAFFGTQEGEFPVIPVLHYARGVAASEQLSTNVIEGGPLRFSYWQVTQ